MLDGPPCIWRSIVDFGIFNISSISTAVTWRSASIMALIWSSSTTFGRPERCQNYWIYNLIRAVFSQNLNVYWRKTCTIVLFKVLPIWSYDFFPSFWKFVDSIPKELRRLGGQEWIKPFSDILFWCEPYSSEGVLHRPEQMHNGSTHIGEKGNEL